MMPTMRLSQYAAAILAALCVLQGSRANSDTCSVCDELWDGGPGDGCYTCDDADCGAPTCPDDCSDCPDGREYMCKTFMVRARLRGPSPVARAALSWIGQPRPRRPWPVIHARRRPALPCQSALLSQNNLV